MHPQPVGVGDGAVMGAVDAHRQAAEHRQPHAQQGLQVGGQRYAQGLAAEEPEWRDGHSSDPALAR
jgi:hypothetical protein